MDFMVLCNQVHLNCMGLTELKKWENRKVEKTYNVIEIVSYALNISLIFY